MKKLIILSFLAISTSLCAQFIPGDAVRAKNSERSKQFAMASEGKKIGSGVCWEFVFEALKQSRPKDYEYVFDHREKFEVDSYDAMPGDVVIFMDVIRTKGSAIKGHVGILMGWVDENTFVYADQNHSFEGDNMIPAIASDGNEYDVAEKSKVGGHGFDLTDVKSGTVKFYRF